MIPSMRLAVAGKGGTGKTTISATLARALARRGRRILAVDADSNPNLGFMLGLAPAASNEIVGLPRNLFERRVDADGTERSVFTGDPDAIVRDFGQAGPDGVELLVMGRVGHGGAG